MDYEAPDKPEPLPEPRQPAGGYESVDWRAAPLFKVYGIPGNDQSIPVTTNPRRQ
jgi:hypothetical protein